MVTSPGPIDEDSSLPEAGVCVFCPAPLLTVTVERHGGEEDRIHLHAGGQGVWVARMVRRLDVPVRLVGCFGGETGLVARRLVESEQIEVSSIDLTGDSSAYVHDRRSGERTIVAESPFPPLERHTLDELYSTTVAAALGAGVCVLTGIPHPDVLPAETYQRLAGDLRTNEVTVIADLCGDQMREALHGGLSCLKVSHEELEAAGLLPEDATTATVVAAAERLRARGADEIVVSRAEQPAVASIGSGWYEVHAPAMQVVDHRGAGDSMTATLAVAAAWGLPPDEALRLAAAAGSLNVTRHGLATGHAEAIERLAERVDLVPVHG
jgi:1-phosphofructokinase